MTEQLSRLRKRLDELDSTLVEQLAERFRIAVQAAAAKRGAQRRLRDPAREAELLDNVRARARELGTDEVTIESVYRSILQQSLQCQARAHACGTESSAPLRVAFQGSEGAYSEIGARRHFAGSGSEITCHGYLSFAAMLDAVASGACDYALLPIENTTAGSINEAYDLLSDTSLAVVGEEILRVEHCLVALEDVAVDSIRRILSHPQALAQCSKFLASLRNCQAQAHADTAMAVERIVSDGDMTQAAVASREAAERHRLTIIARGISNQRDNFTRFLVIAPQSIECDPGLPCKTSLVLVTRHEHGALARCLEVLAGHGLNLTKLESRPRPQTPWEYTFYLDFEGHLADENVAAALRQVASLARYVRVLGSYPAAQPTRVAASVPRARATAKIRRLGPAPAPDRNPHCSSSYRLACRASRADDSLVRIGSVTVGTGEPVLIAGPCSVESSQQVAACAAAVKRAGGHMLRGGCFKPRTSPYSFQGLGHEGLQILADAGRQQGLPIVTEVLHPRDVGAVAEIADVLQVGARNVQNFALLRAVGEAQRPVLLKRGMMSSVEEWLAAAEYILERGNQQVILCERGIRTFETATRFTLDLSAVPVVRERSHLPIIVDPSHAAGVRRWVPSLARAAIAVGAQGIMVEIHPQPDEALSDGAQSLTLPEFEALARALRPEAGLEVAV